MKRILYDDVTEERVIFFIEQWMNVAAHMARYSETNRLVAQNAQLLHGMLADVAGSRSEITIVELHNILLFGGAALSNYATNLPAVGAFVFLMLKHNIRSFRIKSDVDLEDFMSLLSMLAAPNARGGPDYHRTTHVTFGDRIVVELQTSIDERDGSRAAGEVSYTPGQPPIPPISGGPAHTATYSISPRLTAEQGEQSLELEVKILVRVGEVPLAGAHVIHCGGTQEVQTGAGATGAMLYLPRGRHEVEVHIDEYRVRREINVEDEPQYVEIDLQQIFD
ncbi:MAG: hypothetical protein P9L99_12125 [Candidatus Lernaella stagnicola]|nr:hypothetical protein [Candidatus Lernaella stagnicola]